MTARAGNMRQLVAVLSACMACAEPASLPVVPASQPASGPVRNPEATKKFKEAMAKQDPTLFEAAIALDPMLCFAYINAGALRERAKEGTQAQALYQQALSLPDCGEAWAAMSAYLLLHGQPTEAERTAREGVIKFPQVIALRHRYAEALIANTHYAEAEQQALSVLKLDERNAFAMLNLSRAYYAQKKYELARLAADNARAIEPDRGEMFHQLGVLHLQKDERPQALVAFRKAVELRADLVASQINLAQLLGETGDFAGALKAAEIAVAYAPESRKARLALGNALRGARRYADAEKAFIGLSADPDAVYNLGVLYLDAELPGLAIEERLAKAIAAFERLPSNPEVQGFITQAKRQIDSEKKKKERDLKRKATQKK